MTFVNSINSGKNTPDIINVIIEIPKGNNIKYEIDVESGFLFVNRKLPFLYDLSL